MVGILGGSQGAMVLNRAGAGVVAAAGCPVLHLTGPEAHGVEAGAGASLPWVQVPYESNMQDFYAAVDLVVCRAGAMTVSELAVTATPAVFVPLEQVGQTANARVLAAPGGAVIVPQGEIDTLPRVVAGLVANHQARAEMAAVVARFARPDAARTVAARVLEVAGG